MIVGYTQASFPADILQANNISAAQIRDDYARRRQQADQNGDAGEGPSDQTPEQTAAEAEEVAAEAEEAEAKTKKRKRTEEDAIDKIKQAKSKKGKKSKKKGKKGDSDDDEDSDDDYDDDVARDMYKKSRPAPGQLEHCEICNKRFTVTPYSKEGSDGGLLCTPCGKELTKEAKKEQKASTQKPAGRKRRKIESERLDGNAVGGARTLTQLCLDKVAKHHEDIEELGEMPPVLLERLSEIFSKKRVMKPKTLPLFLRPDLDSVVVHDAAYLEEDNYKQIFAVVPNIKRLVLGNAGQVKDGAIEYMLERCHELRHLQMYAANLVTNDMWERLFREAGEKLRVIKLKQIDGTFENETVEAMVQHCPHLERLKLKFCRRLDENCITTISQLAELQHLSLQLSHDVANPILVDLIEQRGHGFRTLSLEKFIDADDAILQAIHDNCTQLSKLRFSENDTATDAGYTALFTDWTNSPLTFADFNSTRDVDNNNPVGPEDAIGFASAGFRALMAHSGAALRHLDISSCRHIELGAFMDVFNGAQSYPQLEHINVSFCNRVDTSVVAGIFKSCPSLKKLVAFGCFDVQDVVVPRSIALIGVPRAQDAIEQFGIGVGVDEAIGRMVRY